MTPYFNLPLATLRIFAVCALMLMLGAVFLLIESCLMHIGRKYIFFSAILSAAVIFILQGTSESVARFQLSYDWLFFGNVTGQLPWIAVMLLMILFAAAEVTLFASIIHRKKNRLTIGAIKESLDALPDGICFFEPDGQPLLVNKQMNKISGELFDSEILNADSFYNRLKEKSISIETKNINANPNITIETPDKKVWEFHLEQLMIENSEIYELLACDITEQYRLTRELEKRNERLNIVNERLRLFSEEMVTFTAEKELLNAKIKVHDNIGRSLLSFRTYLMQPKEERNRKELLFLWKYVVSVMKNETLPSDEWDQLEKTADMLGISIELVGELPDNLKKRTVIVTAIRECLTNTAHHANGDKLFVNLQSHDDSFTAELTNTGKPPEKEIHETGGLKNLRRVVEQANGIMTVISTPRFLLRLEFPKGEELEWLKQEY